MYEHLSASCAAGCEPLQLPCNCARMTVPICTDVCSRRWYWLQPIPLSAGRLVLYMQFSPLVLCYAMPRATARHRLIWSCVRGLCEGSRLSWTRVPGHKVIMHTHTHAASVCTQRPYARSRVVSQINRNSMLARVTEIIRPAARRRGTGAGALTAVSSDTTSLPSAAAGLQLAQDAAAAPSGAGAPDTAVNDPSVLLPYPGQGTDEGGLRARAVLKGKPSAVIKRFVTENNIDMLVIPVTAQPVLRRMDKESKRGALPPLCPLAYLPLPPHPLACCTLDLELQPKITVRMIERHERAVSHPCPSYSALAPAQSARWCPARSIAARHAGHRLLQCFRGPTAATA